MQNQVQNQIQGQTGQFQQGQPGGMMNGQPRGNMQGQQGGFGQGQQGGQEGFQGEGSEKYDKMQQEQNDRFEKQQKQQQERMLKNVKRSMAQMARGITQMDKRAANIQKRGGVISPELTAALQKGKDIVAKVNAATTMEEFQESGIEEAGDFMQTLNEEMQKAEMSTQFPRMVKEANKAVTRQQKSLASAQKRAARLKVSMDSLLSKWQEAVSGMTQAISEAQASFQGGDTETAVEILKDRVFDAMQDIGQHQQVFEMVSNSQKVLKSATAEITSITKKIASVAKKGEDTTEAESALEEAKAAVAEVRQIISDPDVDPETLIGAIEAAEEAKFNLYEAMTSLTGQKYGSAGGYKIPGLNFKQLQAPSSLQQYFRPQQEEQMMGGQQQGFPGMNGGGPGGFGPQIQQGPMIQQQQMIPFGPGGFGPEGMSKPASATSRASIIESIQKQIGELSRQIQSRLAQ